MIPNFSTSKLHLFFLIFFINLLLYPQIGGVNTFEFLNLNTSPRSAALGGSLQSLVDDDVNSGIYNPAVINYDMNSKVVFNYTNYYSDINYGNFGYSFSLFNRQFIASMKYVNYGLFNETNEFGQSIGEFSAGEYLISIGTSHSILDSLISVGINTKLGYSSFYELNSLALLFDLGFVYNLPNQNLSMSFLIRNLGHQIVPYYPGNYESLPFELSFGIVNKLAHVPLRWHLTLKHLETPDLSYDDYGLFSSQINYDNFAYNLLRHINFGAEFLIHKNINLLFGYNNKTRFEMLIEDRKGMVGFSYGFSFKIKRFQFIYSRVSHHFSGTLNSFGILTNLQKID
tara:strand:- start:570 stop:1595 length:1026 start_codon:yes stop_codon:yes gene_type:complete